jgi:hypothetical protein
VRCAGERHHGGNGDLANAKTKKLFFVIVIQFLPGV